MRAAAWPCRAATINYNPRFFLTRFRLFTHLPGPRKALSHCNVGCIEHVFPPPKFQCKANLRCELAVYCPRYGVERRLSPGAAYRARATLLDKIDRDIVPISEGDVQESDFAPCLDPEPFSR